MCSAPLSCELNVCVPHVKKKNMVAGCVCYECTAGLCVCLSRLRVAVDRAEMRRGGAMRELWDGDARVLWLAVFERARCDTAARLIVWWYSGPSGRGQQARGIVGQSKVAAGVALMMLVNWAPRNCATFRGAWLVAISATPWCDPPRFL